MYSIRVECTMHKMSYSWGSVSGRKSNKIRKTLPGKNITTKIFRETRKVLSGCGKNPTGVSSPGTLERVLSLFVFVFPFVHKRKRIIICVIPKTHLISYRFFRIAKLVVQGIFCERICGGVGYPEVAFKATQGFKRGQITCRKRMS